MTFLDTGILVAALLEKHPENPVCFAAVQAAVKPFTNAHALAETFATLTGFYKVPTEVASELTLSISNVVTIEPLAWEDYESAIREARSRGVMGGGIYDALHATFARRRGGKTIITRNPSHFAHAAPDLEIFAP